MLGNGLILKPLTIIYSKISQCFGAGHPNRQRVINSCHHLKKSPVEFEAAVVVRGVLALGVVFACVVGGGGGGVAGGLVGGLGCGGLGMKGGYGPKGGGGSGPTNPGTKKGGCGLGNPGPKGPGGGGGGGGGLLGSYRPLGPL